MKRYDFGPLDKTEEMKKNQKGDLSASEAGENPRESSTPRSQWERSFKKRGPTMSNVSKDEDANWIWEHGRPW